MQKEIIIKELAEEVVKGYFDNGDIIELLQAANRKLKKKVVKMKLKEGEKKISRGWEYKEIYFDLEQKIEQLSFLKGGEQYESCKGNTIQDFQGANKNS